MVRTKSKISESVVKCLILNGHFDNIFYSQFMEDEGRSRAIKAARSLGERSVTELILQHQNPQQLSANLWAAVRARGCQFLGIVHKIFILQFI